MTKLVYKKIINAWAYNFRKLKRREKKKPYTLCKEVINLQQDKNNFNSLILNFTIIPI